MGKSLHNELRKEFQLERLILFSDAVFAIAITLLVIEIKIPELHEDAISDSHLLYALGRLIPKFIGFVVSFMLVGQYWTVHHRMFGYVINFDSRLLWLNIFFLFCIALMPFSTGFYSEYAGHAVIVPSVFYTCNIAALGIVNFFLWRYLGKNSGTLSENLSPALVRYNSTRALTVPVIFVLMTCLYSWKPLIAAFVPMLIPVVLRFGFRSMKNKLLSS